MNMEKLYAKLKFGKKSYKNCYKEIRIFNIIYTFIYVVLEDRSD